MLCKKCSHWMCTSALNCIQLLGAIRWSFPKCCQGEEWSITSFLAIIPNWNSAQGSPVFLWEASQPLLPASWHSVGCSSQPLLFCWSCLSGGSTDDDEGLVRWASKKFPSTSPTSGGIVVVLRSMKDAISSLSWRLVSGWIWTSILEPSEQITSTMSGCLGSRPCWSSSTLTSAALQDPEGPSLALVLPLSLAPPSRWRPALGPCAWSSSPCPQSSMASPQESTMTRFQSYTKQQIRSWTKKTVECPSGGAMLIISFSQKAWMETYWYQQPLEVEVMDYIKVWITSSISFDSVLLGPFFVVWKQTQVSPGICQARFPTANTLFQVIQERTFAITCQLDHSEVINLLLRLQWKFQTTHPHWKSKWRKSKVDMAHPRHMQHQAESNVRSTFFHHVIDANPWCQH